MHRTVARQIWHHSSLKVVCCCWCCCCAPCNCWWNRTLGPHCLLVAPPPNPAPPQSTHPGTPRTPRPPTPRPAVCVGGGWANKFVWRCARARVRTGRVRTGGVRARNRLVRTGLHTHVAAAEVRARGRCAVGAHRVRTCVCARAGARTGGAAQRALRAPARTGVARAGGGARAGTVHGRGARVRASGAQPVRIRSVNMAESNGRQSGRHFAAKCLGKCA